MMSAIKLMAITLDSDNLKALAEFYAKLLGGEVIDHGAFCSVSVPGLSVGLNFQHCEGYQPPVWPEEPGKQQQMEHLDLVVEDPEAAFALAISLGAKKAPQQFNPAFTVMLDPAGHPFCLLPASMFQ